MRPIHEALNGIIFSPGGLPIEPGSEYNCRCVAEKAPDAVRIEKEELASMRKKMAEVFEEIEEKEQIQSLRESIAEVNKKIEELARSNESTDTGNNGEDEIDTAPWLQIELPNLKKNFKFSKKEEQQIINSFNKTIEELNMTPQEKEYREIMKYLDMRINKMKLENQRINLGGESIKENNKDLWKKLEQISNINLGGESKGNIIENKMLKYKITEFSE